MNDNHCIYYKFKLKNIYPKHIGSSDRGKDPRLGGGGGTPATFTVPDWEF